MESWKDLFPKENRYYETENGILYNADCLEILRKFPKNSVDTIITDPPYGLSNHSTKKIKEVLKKWVSGEDLYIPSGKGFMGEEWDKFVPPPKIWKEALNVLKPGGIALVFAGTRTQDLMSISLRLSGFEIKDILMWINSQGFPKSFNIGKAIDDKLGNKRKVIGIGKSGDPSTHKAYEMGKLAKDDRNTFGGEYKITKGNTEWEGYGTALKPAYEPIIMAMKSLDGNYVNNALKWGVAGLNIDGARIGNDLRISKWAHTKGMTYSPANKKGLTVAIGRFPSNLLLDEGAAKILDNQQKGASRFFYVAKASKKERNMGNVNNTHPSVKPITLIEYLATLTKPPKGGIVLDPFLGSGTTAIACEKAKRRWIGIELNKEYCEIAKKRLNQEVK